MAKRRSRSEIFRTTVAPGGEVHALEDGRRIVRYRPRVEVLFEASDGINAIAVSKTGALHAAGKRHHTNAGGQWRSEAVPVSDDLDELTAVWATSDDDVWVGSEEGEVFRRVRGQWKPVAHPLPRKGNAINAIRGGADGRVHLATDEGVASFDERTRRWARAKLPKDVLYLDVLPRASERVVVVGRDGPNLFEGSADARWTRVTGVADDDVDFFAVARGSTDTELFIATGGALLHRVKRTTRVLPFAQCGHVSSIGGVVAAAGEGGVHVLASKTWTFIRSPAAAKPKAVAERPAPKTTKTSAASKLDAALLSRTRGPVRLVRRNEFWEGHVRGSRVEVRFGRVGTKGDGVQAPHASPGAARAHLERAVGMRLAEGYRPA